MVARLAVFLLLCTAVPRFGASRVYVSEQLQEDAKEGEEVLEVQQDLSTEGEIAPNIGSVSVGGAKGPAACMELHNLDQEDVIDTIPGAIYVMLEMKGLQKEWAELTDDLLVSKKGRLGVWKCSALYRSMYIGGHDKAFAAKNVSVFLTKQEPDGFFKAFKDATISICLVDRDEQPTYVPTGVYEDKSTYVTIGRNDDLGKVDATRKFPQGVLGQVFDGKSMMASDKSTMPVELLKLLESKNLMLENMDMAALINIGETDVFGTAKIVSDFQERFKAKGVGLFFCNWRSYYKCKCDAEGDCQTCHEWHYWVEYADFAVVGELYKPTVSSKEVYRRGRTGYKTLKYTVQYSSDYIDKYNKCKETGDSTDLANLISGKKSRGYSPRCSDVAGAETRESKKYPSCKCKDDDAKVFCGTSRVAGRKFDIASVSSLADCKKGPPYCSRKACYPPERT